MWQAGTGSAHRHEARHSGQLLSGTETRCRSGTAPQTIESAKRAIVQCCEGGKSDEEEKPKEMRCEENVDEEEMEETDAVMDLSAVANSLMQNRAA